MKYVAFFDIDQDRGEQRYTVLSSMNKIAYLCNAMSRQGIPVEIVSPAWTRRTAGFFPGRSYALNETTEVRLFASFGASHHVTRGLRYYYSMLQLFLYLLMHVERGERIIVYHAVALIPWINLLRLLKRISLILEIEEIYGDVSNQTRVTRRELAYFKTAAGYLFPTELLHEKINADHKPYVIVYGTYAVEAERDVNRDDGRVHCVYAGTFDPRKGAAAAAAAAEFLDERYHVHIIGFGHESDKNDLLKMIDDVSKRTKCTVTYDGTLSGENYIRFIQRCDIGLSTQNPNANFNETSFPSKVLSYLANGLSVVTIRLKALEHSMINDILHYYDMDTPEAIARAIRSVPIGRGYENRTRVMALDEAFCTNIGRMLASVENHD